MTGPFFCLKSSNLGLQTLKCAIFTPIMHSSLSGGNCSKEEGSQPGIACSFRSRGNVVTCKERVCHSRGPSGPGYGVLGYRILEQPVPLPGDLVPIVARLQYMTSTARVHGLTFVGISIQRFQAGGQMGHGDFR